MIYLLFLFGLFLLEVESSESSEPSSSDNESGKNFITIHIQINNNYNNS